MGRGGEPKKDGAIIPVYNSHTHSKRGENAQILFQFLIIIHIQNAQTAKARTLCVYITSGYIELYS